MPKKLTTEEWITKAIKTHGDKIARSALIQLYPHRGLHQVRVLGVATNDYHPMSNSLTLNYICKPPRYRCDVPQLYLCCVW